MNKIKRIFGFITWQTARKTVYWLVVLALMLIAGLTTVSVLEIPNGLRMFVVRSGSMAPSIPAGSVVVTRNTRSYDIGDVITFNLKTEQNNDIKPVTTTHRIIEIEKVGLGQYEYKTKGDFNPAPDAERVSKKQISGKAVLVIPLLGYLISYAKTRSGLIFLIIIPATLIIYSEILNIKGEIIKILKLRKARV